MPVALEAALETELETGDLTFYAFAAALDHAAHQLDV